MGLQEPIAFLGGVFAGFLGLNIAQDPLQEWIAQTAADARVSPSIAKDTVQLKVFGLDVLLQVQDAPEYKSQSYGRLATQSPSTIQPTIVSSSAVSSDAKFD